MAISPPSLAIPVVDVTRAPLRASRAYELVLFDRLSAEEQEALSSFKEDPEGYGILRPREDTRLGIKSVSRDTALLLLSLQESGRLPGYAARSMGDDCRRLVGKMILDEILEVEINGRMVSGAEALPYLFSDAPLRQTPGRLGSLSCRAVEYAASLGLSDAVELSERLYSYNRLPATRRWRDSLPDEAGTESYLGLDDGATGRGLMRGWRQLPESEAWISWRAGNGAGAIGSASSVYPGYKLYVSPACEQVREAVQVVAGTVARSGAVQWKSGKGIHGLLRPDKIVVYFPNFAALEEVALTIMTRLEGCPPHGVPFTAELGGEGLLSWGLDEPGEAHAGSRAGGESWRSRICDRLAVALIQVQTQAQTKAQTQAETGASPENDAAQFALARLQLDGIDTASWTPLSSPARSR